jgi:putative exosortase-associated protein (TIGR04073 family)
MFQARHDGFKRGKNMNMRILLSALLCIVLVAAPAVVPAEQQPEVLVEKMAVKFTRGLTNVVTSVAELHKQSILTVRDMGGPGYVIGPLKGIGMMVYRTFIGATETAFFMVPQPGYYDPMIDPPYVWEGWEPKRETMGLTEEQK